MQTKTVNKALVYYDERYTHRWVDAFGPDVVKYLGALEQGTDDTTGDPTAFAITVTEAGGGGDSTIVKSTSAGQLFLLTSDNADYDGINAQLKGEAFKIEAGKPLYFGVKFQINDADQTDLLVGLCETDTTLLATATAHAVAVSGDGAFFSTLDGSTTVAFKTYDGGSETNTANAAAALADATDMVLEFYWDGTTLYGYQNDVLVGSFSADLPDADLTVSINFRTGETTANTCAISWLRAIQCR